MKAVSDVFSEYLQKFNEADSLYDSLSQQVADFALLGVLDDEDWDSLKARLSKAKETREHYAVVLCRVLSDYNFFESDAPEDASEDSPVVDPVDSPEDVLEDASEVDPEDVSEDVVAADPVDFPVADPVVVPEDSPAADPVVAPEDPERSRRSRRSRRFQNAPEDPEDSPAMSAKCKLCPFCVDGRCFFVLDIYDSEFPCQFSAWDNFFKSGGSHGPAP